MLVKHWNRLTKEVVDVPALETLQGQDWWASEQPGLAGRVGLDDL